MTRQGRVSTIDNINRIARVEFPELDREVTYEIKIAEHVGELHVGNIVLVTFWSGNITDGAIIAELR
ncbi:hypothetical protein CLPU_6c00460 [Gottschalkia purinilytica]|uniref:Uncharacterized protein n=1 Tax=Gottschalkia purinilytica TaxID=1503 RepID=A0A0L0WB54_GOTPU|nr:hypothetical protein [Gottschalkia purinilytica]KNF08560.1 hypothetical protein CLPU_6c00460 [Gottschalkia purinilytica]